MKEAPDHWRNLFRGPAGEAAQGVLRFRALRKGPQPLLMLPGSGKLAARALPLYPAQTPKARRMRKWLGRALAWNLPLPLEQVNVPFNPLEAFPQFLAAQAGTTGFPELAILLGNPHTAGRRFILLLFDANGNPVRVVKAGVGSAAGELVRREQEFLASVQGSIAAVPRLFGSFQDGHLSAFATEYVSGDSPGPGDTARVTGILEAWTRKSRGTVLVAESTQWQSLRSAAMGHPLLPRLALLERQSVQTVVSHGDFAPWNLKLDSASGSCVAVDWERGQRAGLPGWDWFHYVVQPAILVEKLPEAALRERLESLLASAPFAGYAEECGFRGFERSLALAYLVHCLEVLKPSEGGEQTRALLELLGQTWPNDLKS